MILKEIVQTCSNAEVANAAQATCRSGVELVIEGGLLDGETVRRLLSADAMTGLGWRG